MGILFMWLVTALGLWITTLLVPGVSARTPGTLLLAALVLGLVNAFIRPLLWLLTLPLTVLTFGLFALVVNALTIWLSAALVPGFEVRGFGSALLAALVMALLGLLGFILLQWLMVGEVHWIYMQQRGHGVYL
ncbi:phage holin family protein [Thiohalobacter sp. IOR34]|uniref:phage holin family protein n=1 Tax=Thiohalobacter sp. IOR34 TaxID=3057176 RepID=UPI00339D6C3C